MSKTVRSMYFASLALVIASASVEAAAETEQQPGWQSVATFNSARECLIFSSPVKAGAAGIWAGNCDNGRASGKATLTWTDGNGPLTNVDGNFIEGLPDGPIKWTDLKTGNSVEITYTRGRPGDEAIFRGSSGTILRGGYANGRLDGFADRTVPGGGTFREFYSKGQLVYSEIKRTLQLKLIDKLEVIGSNEIVAYASSKAVGSIVTSVWCPSLKKGKDFKLIAYKEALQPSAVISINGKACTYEKFEIFH